jgi:hypothetical protein
MPAVKISVVVIVAWKYLRASGGVGLYAWLDIISLTEFTSMKLAATNIMEKMTKIAKFNDVEGSTPLYEENFTIDESKTAMPVKINMKIIEFFLVRFKVA